MSSSPPSDQADKPNQEVGPEVDDSDLDEIPKLPRGHLFRGINFAHLIRIGMFASILVAIIMLRKPCAEGVSNYFESLSPEEPATPAPAPQPRYERLSPEQIRERFKGPEPAETEDGSQPAEDGLTEDEPPVPEAG